MCCASLVSDWRQSSQSSTDATVSRAKLGKKIQLLFFDRGPPQGPEERKAAEEKLRLWKKTPAMAHFQSWSEVPGFFDAEGGVLATHDSVRLEIMQKQRPMLEAVQQFLHKELGAQCVVRPARKGMNILLIQIQ